MKTKFLRLRIANYTKYSSYQLKTYKKLVQMFFIKMNKSDSNSKRKVREIIDRGRSGRRGGVPKLAVGTESVFGIKSC